MIVKLAIAMLAGGIAAQHSRVLISWDQCLLILVALAAVLCLRQTRLLAAFCTGFVILHLSASLIVENRLDERYAGDSMLAVVRVIDFPDVSDTTITMIVAPIDDSRLPPKSRVTWFEAPVRPALGDTWQLELRLRRPRGAANPGGFDSERWLFREKIHAVGYVVPGLRNRLLRSGATAPVDGLRAAVVRAAAVVPDEQGVIAAVAVGARQEIDRAQWERYAQTGTSHLVAISGLHVGLAAVAAFAIFYGGSVLLGRTGSHLCHATVGGILLATAYAVVSGLGIPAQRAVLMLMLAAIAVMARRRIRPVHILALCALAVFIADPVATMAPGFALSFGAVGILYRAARNSRHTGTWTGYLGSLWCAQLKLFFGLLPLTVLFFERIALVAPPVNLIVVPLFSLLSVPAALAAVVAVTLDLPIVEPCLQLAALGVRLVDGVVDMALELPFASATVVEQEGVLSAIPWLALLWVVLPRGWPGRALAPLAVACLLQSGSHGPSPGCVDIHVLDVGQGQSVVVRTARHTLVYDAGPAYRSGGSAAQHVVVPFLRQLGIRDIDWLVVSHADLDHAGGVQDLEGAVRIQRIFASEPLGIAGLNVFACAYGQRWRADGVEFAVLHPLSGSEQSRNNGSCVLEVAVGRKRALLTGDIESVAEDQLLRREVLRRSVLVTVPHHGSETSSGPALINRLAPAIAIASTGYRNRWNFPSERIRRRWEGIGARFYDTGTSGAVSTTLCRWRVPRAVREERQQRLRFWHDDAGR